MRGTAGQGSWAPASVSGGDGRGTRCEWPLSGGFFLA